MVKDPRADMVFGAWSYDDKDSLLQIALTNGIKENYEVKRVGYKELLMHKEGEKEHSTKYTADGFVHKDLSNDPFYPPNMLWRVRAKIHEDSVAISLRMKGCLHFFYLCLIDNIKRNATSISFYGLPDCFVWYSGGIGLKEEEKLNRSWRNIFYDSINSNEAHGLLAQLINEEYNWIEDKESWVKESAGVLKQMEAKIDSL